MALRVLLADESTTIKKVMQLALQDYAVEVKSVPVGLDVISVAKSFKPDIFFIDVLLPKRNGYEVAKDIKSDSTLSSVPVVLMWSGFMEFDEQKSRDSRAEQRLEKPFDADQLRHLVKELVPRTQTNVISDYLTFPPLPDFQEDAVVAGIDTENPFSGPTAEINEMQMAPASGSADFGSIYEVPEVDESGADQFQTVPLNMESPIGRAPKGDENWTHKDLSSFMVPTDDLSQPQISSDGEFEEVTFEMPGAKKNPMPSAKDPKPMPLPPTQGVSASDEVRADRILREESRAVLEKIAWQILPDLCERVVKEELNRLLKSVEKTI